MSEERLQIQAVVFDFAGVLVGSLSAYQNRWERVARRVGLADGGELERFLHPSERGQGHSQPRWAERMAALNVPPEQWGDLYQQLFDSWATDPECLEVVEALDTRGVRLALLSNGEGTAAGLMQHYPFLARFEAILLSGEMGVGKPAQAAFHAVEQRLALTPQHLLFVDDARHNVAAARRFGWQAHVYEDVPTLRAELSAWHLL